MATAAAVGLSAPRALKHPRRATLMAEFVGDCRLVRPSFVVTDEVVRLGRASEWRWRRLALLLPLSPVGRRTPRARRLACSPALR
jgi:hypothetical protein